MKGGQKLYGQYISFRENQGADAPYLFVEDFTGNPDCSYIALPKM